MIAFSFVAILVTLLCVQCASFVQIDIPPGTISEFDPSAYSGRWFQVYTSLIPTLSYEKDGFCIVADYSNVDVTEHMVSFDVMNSENKGSPTGELSQSEGRAINDHPHMSPGKFRLTFDGVKAPFAGFYWIVRVGEIEQGENAQYPWAVVSVPFQTSLFILARDIDEFKFKYESDVLALVRELGYTSFYNKPVETVHSADCKYPPVPKGKPAPPATEMHADFVEEYEPEVDEHRALQDESSRPSSEETKKPRSPHVKRSKRPSTPSTRKTKQPKPPRTQRPHTESPLNTKPPTAPKPSPPPKPEPSPTPLKPSAPEPLPTEKSKPTPKPKPPPVGPEKPKPPPPPPPKL